MVSSDTLQTTPAAFATKGTTGHHSHYGLPADFTGFCPTVICICCRQLPETLPTLSSLPPLESRTFADSQPRTLQL